MPALEVLYFSDRMAANDPCMTPDIQEPLRQKGYIDAGSQKIFFCGLLWVHNRIAVFLPRNHVTLDKPEVKAAHYLLRALVKFYRSRSTGIREDDDGPALEGGASLSIAIALLEDYLSNGLYVRRTRNRTRNDGKVNWSRTLAQSTAYPSANGDIFLDFSSTRISLTSNTTTAQIHAAIIQEVLSTIGSVWLGRSDAIEAKLKNTPAPSIHRTAWIPHLRKELQASYSDRDIVLLRRMVEYLENKKGSASGPHLIGVNKFHALWEAMLDECLIGNERVNDRLPVPAYQTSTSNFEIVANKGQRTDTVLKSRDGAQIAVVDAKYYDASTAQSAPGWPDIIKQFYYQKFVEKLFPRSKTSSHFIFPGIENKPLAAAFLAARGSKPLSAADCLDDYAPIYCHYQEPLELLRLYATGGKLGKLTDEIFAATAIRA